MTDEALRGVAAQCANLAKTDMRNKRSFAAVIATYNDGEGLHRLRDIERTICELAGEDWLNSGPAKEKAFGILRKGLAAMPQQCIAFATKANDFVPTAKLDALPTDQKRRIATAGNIWDQVKAGYFTPHDALAVTVQTAERVCMFKQRLMGGSLLVGEPEIMFVDQSEFGGRMKMFGPEKSEL